MGKSINPMWCSFNAQSEAVTGSAPGLIVLMSLQSAIPWRVALLHCPPPLHRLNSIYHSPAEIVNHHLARAGEFSTGIMRNFQLVLTHRPAEFSSRSRSGQRSPFPRKWRRWCQSLEAAPVPALNPQRGGNRGLPLMPSVRGHEKMRTMSPDQRRRERLGQAA